MKRMTPFKAKYLQYSFLLGVILSTLTLQAQDSISTQKDTIIVGINSQTFKVSAPALNKKIRINLDDSSSSYQIEIAKLGKSPEIAANNNEVNSKDSANKKRKTKRKKEYSYKYLSEVELGYGMAIGSNYRYFFPNNYIAIAQATFSNVSETYLFSPTNPSNAIFTNLTLKEKKHENPNRKIKFYSRSTLDFRLTAYRLNGTTEIFKQLNDTTTDKYSSKTNVMLTTGQLSKRWTQGVYLNSAKSKSLEFGMSLGLSFGLFNRVSIKNSSNKLFSTLEAERTLKSLLSPYVPKGLTSNLFVGYNHKKLSVNARFNPQGFGLGRFYLNPNVFLSLGYKL